jgi:flagellar protein FlaF
MAIASQANQIYSDVATNIQTPRSVEYQVFARVTRKLSLLQGKDIEFNTDGVGAIVENQRLWNLLASDVLSEKNELSEQMRASIVSLAIFMRSHSQKVLNGDADVDAIVEINTMIMRGLRGNPGVVS